MRVRGVRGGGWNGLAFRRGGWKTESMLPMLWMLWLSDVVPDRSGLEVDLAVGSVDRRRSRPETAYVTG